MDKYDDQASANAGVAGLSILVRQRWRFITVWTLVCTAIASFAIIHLAPRYRAEAVLLLSTRVEHLSDLKSVVSGPLPAIPDPNVARGEVEVLQGRLLASRVIRQLDLENSPDLAPHEHLSARLSRLLERMLGLPSRSDPAPLTAVQRMTAAEDDYMKRFSAFNDGRSFTLSLSYASSNPDLAALVVNTHAALYLADQQALKRQAAEQTTQWLRNETGRLHGELEQKEDALRLLRERAGLVGSAGSTALERQVTDLGTSVAQANADVATREAQLADIRQGGSSDIQSGVLESDLIHKLREQEAITRQQVAGLSRLHGSAYPPLNEARSELADITSKISQETTRIVRGLQTDLVIALRREADLTATLAVLQGKRDQQAHAAEDVEHLEHEAQATRSIYETLLGRLGEIQAQIGAEVADARVISPAGTPDRPFFPNVPLFISIALIVSACSGTGLAWLLEWHDRGVMTSDDLEGIGLPALEALPLVSRSEQRGGTLPDLLLAKPKCLLADQVRALRGQIALPTGDCAPRVLALTSAMPGEGKTTAALLLGRSMAASGLQVLLIECDLRRPSISRQLGLSATPTGLVGVLRDGSALLPASTITDPRSSLRILAVEENVARPQDLLSGDPLRRLLAEARELYDYVLVDTPPIGAVSDAVLIAPHADKTLLVVRWQTTPIAAVKAVARKLLQHRVHVAGVVLNATDLKRATPYKLASMYRAGRSYAE